MRTGIVNIESGIVRVSASDFVEHVAIDPGDDKADKSARVLISVYRVAKLVDPSRDSYAHTRSAMAPW